MIFSKHSFAFKTIGNSLHCDPFTSCFPLTPNEQLCAVSLLLIPLQHVPVPFQLTNENPLFCQNGLPSATLIAYQILHSLCSPKTCFFLYVRLTNFHRLFASKSPAFNFMLLLLKSPFLLHFHRTKMCHQSGTNISSL